MFSSRLLIALIAKEVSAILLIVPETKDLSLPVVKGVVFATAEFSSVFISVS